MCVSCRLYRQADGWGRHPLLHKGIGKSSSPPRILSTRSWVQMTRQDPAKPGRGLADVNSDLVSFPHIRHSDFTIGSSIHESVSRICCSTCHPTEITSYKPLQLRFPGAPCVWRGECLSLHENASVLSLSYTAVSTQVKDLPHASEWIEYCRRPLRSFPLSSNCNLCRKLSVTMCSLTLSEAEISFFCSPRSLILLHIHSTHNMCGFVL